jgi:hypothetical protein
MVTNLFFMLNYQMLDKEKNTLRKNALSSLEIGSETSLRIPTDKRVDFLICQTCFWCTSCFNFDELSVISCPLCRKDHIEQLPVLNQ